MNKKTLEQVFPFLTPREIEVCIRVSEGDLTDDASLPKQTREWLAQCFNRPRDTDIALNALNTILGGFGVEAIRSKNPFDPYYQNVRACYVNMGDIYAATIIRDNKRERWSITSMGDFVGHIRGLL